MTFVYAECGQRSRKSARAEVCRFIFVEHTGVRTVLLLIFYKAKIGTAKKWVI